MQYFIFLIQYACDVKSSNAFFFNDIPQQYN